jgi:soluble lytic murein transglycosylase-like protein
MGTIIDALVVELGFDTKGVKKGAKELSDSLKQITENSDTTAKSMAKSADAVSESFNNLKINIMGALAAFGVSLGIKDFLSDSTKTQASLQRLGQNLDMSGSRLDAWRTTMEEMGGTFDDFKGSISAVATGMAEAVIKGHSALTDTARANGVALQDSKGHWLDYEHTLIAISARMQQLAAGKGAFGRQQALYLAQQLGVGGMGNELLLGPDALQGRVDAAERLSRVTQQSTLRAAELQKQWADVEGRFRGIGEGVFGALEPVLIHLGNSFADTLDKIDFDKLFREADAFVEGIDWAGMYNWINQLGTSFNDLSHWVENLNKQSGGWLKILGELTAAWWLLDAAMDANPISIVIALGAAILALYNDYQVWQKGGHSIVDWKQWKSEIGIAKDLVDALAASLNALGKAYNGVKGYLGQNAALHAKAITEGTDSQHGYSKGSASHELFKNIAYWAGYDPNTGQKIDDKYMQDPADTPDATPAPAASTTPNWGTDKFGDTETKLGLPQGVLGKLAQVESGGNPNAVSAKGAIGLFQIMPATGEEYGASEADLRDPEKASQIAGKILADYIKQVGGNVELGIAAYNAGPGAVKAAGGVPNFKETQDYVRKFGYSTDSRDAYARGNVDNSTSTGGTTIQIAKVDIVTQATDAKGIMDDMQRQLPHNGFVSGSNSGIE